MTVHQTMGDIVSMRGRVIIEGTDKDGNVVRAAHDAESVAQLTALAETVLTRLRIVAVGQTLRGLGQGAEPDCGEPGTECWYDVGPDDKRLARDVN